MTTTSVAAPATGVRPGGRSARVRAAVHRSVVDLLAEAPAENLTIPQVAARAGVHPTTVYRRWGSVADLVAAVASSRFTGDLVVPDTGDLGGDLRRWAREVAADLSDPDSLALIRAAIGAAGPIGGQNCVADRQAQLAAMIEREQGRGGVTPDPARAAELLLGPLYYRALFTRDPLDPDWAGRLVDTVLEIPGR